MSTVVAIATSKPVGVSSPHVDEPRKNWAAGQRRRELDDWSRNPPAEGRLEDISRSRRGASHVVVAVA